MTLARWSFRKMPLRVPQEPIITEQKNGGVTTPAPLAVPYQEATVRTNPITGELNCLASWRRTHEPVQNEESCALLDALVEGGAYYETRRSARWTRDLCDDAAVGADDVRRRRWEPPGWCSDNGAVPLSTTGLPCEHLRVQPHAQMAAQIPACRPGP